MMLVNTQRGLTLMELLVTMAIAAVLMAAAVPAFTATIQTNRAAAQTNNFVAALARARNEAMKAGVSVTMCRSADQTTCDGGGAGWEVGWILFTEYGGNIPVRDFAGRAYAAGSVLTAPVVRADGRLFATGTTLADGFTSRAEDILASGRGLAATTTLRGNNNVVQRITFNNQGMTPGGVGTFTFCDARGASAAREVRVSVSGQIRLCRPVTTGTQPCDSFAPVCP